MGWDRAGGDVRVCQGSRQEGRRAARIGKKGREVGENADATARCEWGGREWGGRECGSASGPCGMEWARAGGDVCHAMSLACAEVCWVDNNAIHAPRFADGA